MARRRRSPSVAVAAPAVVPVLAPPPLPRWLPLLLGAAVVGGALGLYWLTAARDIVVGDTPEFVTAAATLGVPHPPGYPLFTLLGHVATLLPLGPVPFRVSVLVLACSAATVGLLYATARRLTGDARAAVLAALLLAVNPLYWTWSLVPEVFALNNLLAALLLYLLVCWHARPQRARLLVAAAFVAGLGLTNHQTIALLGPAVLYLLWHDRAALLARPWIVAACAGALLAGLVPYAYVPWAATRQPVVNWGGVATWADFLGLVTRASYGAGQLVSTPGLQGGSPLERVAALLASYSPLEGLLLLLGVLGAWQRERWYCWVALLAFAATGPTFALYANVNLAAPGALFVMERFFLLAHVVVAPLAACGVLLAAERLAAAFPRAWSLAPWAVVVSIVLITAAVEIVESYAAIDQSANHTASRFAEDVLASLEPGEVLLAGGDEAVLPLLYAQVVEGIRPDVPLVIMPLLPAPWYVDQLRARYPDLTFPFGRYDGRTATMKSLVDANQGRAIAVVGNVLDDTLQGTYWLYYRGLVARLLPLATDVGLRQMTADTERLLARYQPPASDRIKAASFEPGILRAYAAVSQRMGAEYERVGRPAEARDWYERALAVDPTLPDAREARARVAAQAAPAPEPPAGTR